MLFIARYCSCFEVYFLISRVWCIIREKMKINTKGFMTMREKRNIKALINLYKMNKGCKICGYNEYAVALDFHHPDDNKLFNVSEMVWEGHEFKDILKEIEKCEVLCSNCHRVISRRSW